MFKKFIFKTASSQHNLLHEFSAWKPKFQLEIIACKLKIKTVKQNKNLPTKVFQFPFKLPASYSPVKLSMK